MERELGKRIVGGELNLAPRGLAPTRARSRPRSGQELARAHRPALQILVTGRDVGSSQP